MNPFALVPTMSLREPRTGLAWQRRRFRAAVLALTLAMPLTPWARDSGMPSAEELQQMQKAMQDGMRDMQQQMDKLDPETRRQFEQLKNQAPTGRAYSDEAAPTKDNARIGKVSTKPLDPAGLKAYLQALQPRIAAALSPAARKRAEQVDALLRQESNHLPRLRATANALTLVGAWPEAIYLMGKVALASGSAQDLSNLAAFLSMQRAEAAALPILITLNARYPNNSTLANNIGQAWYGLGDSKEAEKWLTLAVRTTPYHPQANFTEARIQEARGDHKAAQTSMHNAMRGGYTEAKEVLLRKSGGELTGEDVRLRSRLRTPQDGLGLARFTRPPYARSAYDLLPMWRAQEEVKAAYDGALKVIAAKMAALPKPTLSTHVQTLRMPFLAQMTKATQFENDRHRRAMERLGAEVGKAYLTAGAEESKLVQRVKHIDAEGEKKYAQVAGGYQFDYSCDQVMGAVDDYLNASMPAIEGAERAMLDELRRHYNELAFLSQFTAIPVEFERVKLTLKNNYLAKLSEFPYFGAVKGLAEQRKAACLSKKKAKKQDKFQLPDFDDIHCKYVSSWNSPLGHITSRCNVIEATFDPAFSPFKASWAMENTGRGDETRWLNASAEITVEGVTLGGHAEFDADGVKSGGVSASASTEVGPRIKAGPVEMGMAVGVSAGAEFTRDGFSGLNFQVGAEGAAEAGSSSVSTSAELEGNIDSNWSWNAGYNESGTPDFDSSKL